MLSSTPAGEANHRAGTETAATNIHGDLLYFNDLVLVLKICFPRFLAGAIQKYKGVSVQVHNRRVKHLLMIKCIVRLGSFRGTVEFSGH